MSTVDLLQNIAIITLLFMLIRDRKHLNLVGNVLVILCKEYENNSKEEGESEDG